MYKTDLLLNNVSIYYSGHIKQIVQEPRTFTTNTYLYIYMPIYVPILIHTYIH